MTSMSGQLVPRSSWTSFEDEVVSPRVRRDRDRALDRRSARRDVVVHNHQAEAEEDDARIKARAGLAGVVAQVDARLTGFMAALPVHDKSDVEFRAALLQATRAGALADVWGYGG